MTEAEWLADLKQSLKYLRPRASDRKRRLFAVACCRRVWQHLNGSNCHTALDLAEAFADRRATRADLSDAESFAYMAEKIQRDAGNAAGAAAAAAVYSSTCRAVEWDFAEATATSAATAVGAAATRGRVKEERLKETQAQLSLLREIFGNPFRRTRFDLAWRTDTALAVAQSVYDSRNYGALPILADALQDAGCDNEDLLNHLRDTTATHVRGCWALDLVLGKV